MLVFVDGMLEGFDLCIGDLWHRVLLFALLGRAELRTDFEQVVLNAIEERIEVGRNLREASEGAKEGKAAAIMDVAPEAVERAFAAVGCRLMIHGHTHRPARHEHSVAGRNCVRWVLPDWYEAGGYLEASPAGMRAVAQF